MKKIHLILILLICIALSCKKEKKVETIKLEKQELSTAEKIAKAHGYDNWKNVNKVQFNFNGMRHWQWFPKTGEINYSKDSININYNRSAIDSSLIKIDRNFINDKYWLLVPFQLIWDKGLAISEPIKIEAPISKEIMSKITLTYSTYGGYTPGDAYDVFYDDGHIIREWIFRKANQEAPSLTTTFENYQDFNGIKIATEHKNSDGTWNLKLSAIEIN